MLAMAVEETGSTRPHHDLFYIHVKPPPRADGSPPSTAPIVFLHGLESCHLEFSRVTPFLAEFELILVDLPGHSGSKHILPLTLENAANALFHLIGKKVAGGKAHIVGLSLGGYVGLELAQRYPGLVLSLFCTGCAPDSGIRRWVIRQAKILSALGIVGSKIANESMFWAPMGVEPHPELRKEFRKNQSMALLKAGYTAVGAVALDDLCEINGVRVAIVAGAKRDSVEDTRKAGMVLSTKNPACKAFVVREAVHLCDLQLPELFAQGVRAWVAGAEMPPDFEELAAMST
ncbi:Alpha/Beta hydrolase protein [Ampelomyces quisqualis]|uniref:Alpha/Beta hydrolase protein n=1 Tax=Ampelomyces quisqualis TaxID=50730 RepID=A0A6A5Q9Z2_AMPQU|nr:Alpha/Beta hydrolase protein [Ampelomyces quisqualis]